MALCACAKSDRRAGGRTRHRASDVPLSAGVLPMGHASPPDILVRQAQGFGGLIRRQCECHISTGDENRNRTDRRRRQSHPVSANLHGPAIQFAQSHRHRSAQNRLPREYARVNGGRIIPPRRRGIWQADATTPCNSASKVTNRLICRSNNPSRSSWYLTSKLPRRLGLRSRFRCSPRRSCDRISLAFAPPLLRLLTTGYGTKRTNRDV